MASKQSSKTAIITGAAGGIGKAITRRLINEGYRVAAIDVQAELLHNSFSPGDDLLVETMDIRDAGGWQSLLETVRRRFGRLDYLFNIAAVITPGLVHQIPLEEIDRHIDINVKGLFYGTRLAAEMMVAQGSGHIINIASLAGIAPIPGISLYSASKFAVRGYSLAIAEELRAHNVYVTVICPDLVDTPMLDKQLDYSEAALPFSGSRHLSVSDIEKVIFKAMKKRPREIALPASRAVTARIAGLLPVIAGRLNAPLTRRGLKRQQELKNRRPPPQK